MKKHSLVRDTKRTIVKTFLQKQPISEAVTSRGWATREMLDFLKLNPSTQCRVQTVGTHGYMAFKTVLKEIDTDGNSTFRDVSDAEFLEIVRARKATTTSVS